MAKLEYLEQYKKEKEWRDLIEADKAAAKYKKHYEICSEIINQIFELSYKVIDYRRLTDDLIPPKIWRDWVKLFTSGSPICPDQAGDGAIKPIERILNMDGSALDEQALMLLDTCDFTEYKDVIGEWELLADNLVSGGAIEIKVESMENPIVGHIVYKLQELCYPPPPEPPRPNIPEFPLKVVLIGKPFTFKTAALKHFEKSKKKSFLLF